jgi:hypothetical protein
MMLLETNIHSMALLTHNQVGCGSGAAAFAVVILCFDSWGSSVASLLVPSLGLSCITVVLGFVGVFAWKRPRDVRSRLTLALDWFTLLLDAGNATVS